MSEADKLFEELGYQITENIKKKTKECHFTGVQFTKIGFCGFKQVIEFYYDFKKIVIYAEQEINERRIRNDSILVDMQELQAINLKCKELGWID